MENLWKNLVIYSILFLQYNLISRYIQVPLSIHNLNDTKVYCRNNKNNDANGVWCYDQEEKKSFLRKWSTPYSHIVEERDPQKNIYQE